MEIMYNQEFVIRNSYLTEIDYASPAAGENVYFRDYPNLIPKGAKDFRFTGVEAYYADVLSFSPNKIALCSLSDLSKMTLTIAVGSDERLYRMPCTNLCTFLNGGFIRKLARLGVTITKSYITFMEAPAVSDRAVCFNWYYDTVMEPPAPAPARPSRPSRPQKRY